MKILILHCALLLCLLQPIVSDEQVPADQVKPVSDHDDYLIAAERWILPGTLEKGVYHFLGKPSFIDSLERLWYPLSSELRKEMKMKADEVYVRVSLKNGVVTLVERLEITVAEKTRANLLLENMHRESEKKSSSKEDSNGQADSQRKAAPGTAGEKSDG